MKGFAMLWGKILESSLWVQESKETRLVWITLLAMKNAEGKIFASVVGLADRAKVSVDECKKALKVLQSPDKEDTSGVMDGRRIIPIRGGWEIVNNDLYRFSTEAKRLFWAQEKAEQRAKQKAQEELKARGRKNKGKPSGAELAYAKAFKNGASEKELNHLSDPNKH